MVADGMNRDTSRCMSWCTRTVWTLALAGCGGPVLQNAPSPDPAHVAAAAAGAAAALTLADPDGQARKREKDRPQNEARERGKKKTTHVPHDVLDRLDQADAARKPGPDSAVKRSGAP
ncbi:MAG TPA: hypothetical protein VK698_10835 [Kofleriaceae bacterium]|nr:hypothetical protein [Kofleriaceae bacterium]